VIERAILFPSFGASIRSLSILFSFFSLSFACLCFCPA